VPLLGPWRRRDYLALPDWPRQELVFGRFYRTSSPSFVHQAVATLILLRLREAARRTGGRAAIAPLDVTLADHSVVQPDVIYISAARLGVIEDRIEGAPDLLVEVLSPGSKRLDRGEKRALYAASGVREYWLVDSLRRTVDFLVRRPEGTDPSDPDLPALVPAAATAFLDGRYRSAALPEIGLDVQALWADVDLELPPPAAAH
jgi:Uma2 family endonuclease